MPHLNWISIAKNQDNKKEYAHESDKSTDKQLCKVKYIVGQSKNVIFITFQFKKKMHNPQMHRLRRQEGGRADGLPVGYRYQETGYRRQGWEEEEAQPQQQHRPQGEGAGDDEFQIGPLLG